VLSELGFCEPPIRLSSIPESGKGRGESASSAVIGGATISLVLCNCVPRFRN